MEELSYVTDKANAIGFSVPTAIPRQDTCTHCTILVQL